MPLPKLPTMSGLSTGGKVSMPKPFKKKPLNLHRMLQAKLVDFMKSGKLKGIVGPIAKAAPVRMKLKGLK